MAEALTQTSGITVTRIRDNLVHLDAVKRLAKENERTIGLFPFGAFNEYAVDGRILVAIDESNKCVGYLLYRTSRDRATIVHLVVDDAARSKGVARSLVQHLLNSTKHLLGVGLKC